jgi:hypothetical protein
MSVVTGITSTITLMSLLSVLNMDIDKLQEYKENLLIYHKHVEGKGTLWSKTTRGNIKKRLLIVAKDGFTEEEDHSLRETLNLKSDQDVFIAIKINSADAFRTAERFLKAESDIKAIGYCDIVAIYLGFPVRPFSRYRKVWNSGLITSNYLDKFEDLGKSKSNKQIHTKNYREDGSKGTLKKKSNIIIGGILTLFIIGIIGSIVFSFFLDEKDDKENCLAWVNDHYEEFPCNTKFLNQKGITIHTNNGEINFHNFKRINPDQNTQFYDENDNPLVWYANNMDNSPEFFNMPGNHPESGKSLGKVPKELVAIIRHSNPEKIEGNELEKPESDASIKPDGFINNNIKNDNIETLAILAFNDDKFDNEISNKVREQFYNENKKVEVLFIEEEIPSIIKTELKNGNFSSLVGLGNHVDFVQILNSQYQFSTSTFDSGLIVCSLKLERIVFDTLKSKVISRDTRNIKGSGFTESEARTNTIEKVTL